MDGLWSIEMKIAYEMDITEKGVVAIRGNRVLGGELRLFYDGYINISDDGSVKLDFEVKNQNKQVEKIWSGGFGTFNKCVGIELSGHLNESNTVELKGNFKGFSTNGVTVKLTKLAEI